MSQIFKNIKHQLLRFTLRFKRKIRFVNWRQLVLPAKILLGLVVLVGIILWIRQLPPRAPKFKKNNQGNYSFAAKNKVFETKLGLMNKDPMISFSLGEEQNIVFLYKADENATPTLSSENGKILYAEVEPGLDIQYQTLPLGIKEEIILHQARQKNSNVFLFESNFQGAYPKEKIKGMFSPVFYDEKNKYLFHFEKPFAIDAAGNRTDDVSLQIEDKSNSKIASVQKDADNGTSYLVRLTVDEKWLKDPARVYPITIDPTVVHDTTSEFATGQLNRVSNVGNITKTTPLATGGSITYKDGYAIHTFTSGTNSFTPTTSMNVEVLAVAGGGGSRTFGSGGGGGGGVISNTSYSVTASTPVTVTVGDGGAAGTNGSNSIFGTLTAIGGGTSGNDSVANGSLGGSGGGAGTNATGTGTGGAGTAGQGYAGGNQGSQIQKGGGGGGAGGVGIAGNVNSRGGDGGPGIASLISGSWAYYGGGGGGSVRTTSSVVGGNGGIGGGGRGDDYNSLNGTAGTANTGGGGGGAQGYTNGSAPGHAGGSGIVIVRYYVGFDDNTPSLENYYQELATDKHTVGLWHMNEASGNVLDFSGNSLTGTPTGTAVVSGLLGNARSFNGSSDLINVGGSAQLASQFVTVEAWVKTTSTTAMTVFDKISATTGGWHAYNVVVGPAWASSTAGQVSVRIQQTATPTFIDFKTTATVNDGYWHHITFTFGADYVGKIYIDGVLQATSAKGGAIYYSATTNNAYIGKDATTGGLNYFSGTIDEVRISNVARTPEEIKTAASRRPSSTYTSDVIDLTYASVWNSFSWSELGVGTGDGETPFSSTNLTAQWNLNETSGTTAVSGGSCGTACNGTLTSFASTGSQDATPLTGWTANNRRWGAGALMFDGTDDRIVVADNNALDFGTANSFSVEAWVNSSLLEENAAIISKTAAFADNSVGYLLDQSPTSGWIFRVSDGTGTAGHSSAATSLSNYAMGQWTHLVGVYDASTDLLYLYVNGVLKSSAAATYGPSANAGALYVGSYFTGNFFRGIIDSPKIYSRALSTSEILSNYNSSNIQFQTRIGASANANDGTWEAWRPLTTEAVILSLDADVSNWSWDNTATYMPKYKADDTVTKIEGSGSLKLQSGALQTDANTMGLWHFNETSGTGAYLKDSSTNGYNATPTSSGIADGISSKGFNLNGRYAAVASPIVSATTNVTAEFWINVASASQACGFLYFTNNGVGIGIGNTMFDNISSNYGNKLVLLFENVRWVATGVTVNTGWHHIAVVLDKDAVPNVYVDGVFSGRFTGSAPNFATTTSTIGGSGGRACSNNNIIDDLRVSNVARNSEEIAENYRLGANHYINRSISSTDLSSKTMLPFYVAADKPGSYLQALFGESAFANYQSDTNTVALLHMDENYSKDPISDASTNNNYGSPGGVIFHTFESGVETWAARDGAWSTPAQDCTTSTVGSCSIKTNDADGGSGSIVLSTSTSYSSTDTKVSTNYKCDASARWGMMLYNGSAWACVQGSGTTGCGASYTAKGSFYPAITCDNTWRYAEYDMGANYPGQTISQTILGDWNAATTTNLGKWMYFDQLQFHQNEPTTTQGKIGNGMNFNGTNNFVSIGNAPGLSFERTSAFSISFWIKAPATSSHYFPVANKMVWAAGQKGWRILSDYTGSSLVFTLTDNHTVSDIALYLANVLDNNWHYVTFTYDGNGTTNGLKGYLDGNLVASGGGGNLTSTTVNTMPVTIGGNPNSAAYGIGSLDEFRVDNVVRTQDQIRQAYESGFHAHSITIDFAASLDSGNLIANSADASFTIDATTKGLSSKGDKLYVGDTIIIRENVNGTEYIAQGIVNSVNSSTGATTVISWGAGSTFPTSGFTINADAFKWQREYFDLSGIRSDDKNAITNLTLRLTDGNEGRTIWLDDLKSVSNYLTNPLGSTILSSLGSRYFQYRAILSSSDPKVSASFSTVSLDYAANTEPGTPSLSANYVHDKIKTLDTTPEIRFSDTDPENNGLIYQVSWGTDSSFPSESTATSDTNAGFTNITTPADTSPFNSGDTVSYTFQTALTNGVTYFYRVRAKDSNGSIYGSWSEIKSLTIDTSLKQSAWFETHADQFIKDILLNAIINDSGNSVTLFSQIIDNADTASNWISSDTTNTVVSQETTIKQEGTGSVKTTTNTASSTTIDLMEYASDGIAQAAFVSNFVGISATGGTMTTSGGYSYHTFTSGGTFTSTTDGLIDILVVGGGGGGGTAWWNENLQRMNEVGGGGGGGLVNNINYSLSTGAYSVIVGAGGGAGGSVSNGGNSSFGSLITAYGGGKSGTAGGSGGGANAIYSYGNYTTGILAGAATQPTSTWGGYGHSSSNGNYGPSGGGGAGGSGTTGVGGVGMSVWGATYSKGGNINTGTAGANTGNGGMGRSSSDGAGGVGGSGIVIVRYPTPPVLQSYTESTIKTQGSYSLKGTAIATHSLNKTLTKTFASPINLSNNSSASIDIRSTRTGSNIKIGLRDSGGTITEITPNITAANTFQTATFDLSGVTNANKDAIDQIIITIVNADADNTFYVDNLTALQTSLDDTVTLTKTPTNLSAHTALVFWVRSDTTGQNFRFQFGEANSSEQTYNITINAANTWERKVWDISGITASSRDAVTQFAFKVIGGSTAQNFFFDNITLKDSSGSVLSTPLTASGLANSQVWKSLIFNSEPAGDVSYQIYYDVSGTPTIVPDSVMPGNSTGFTTSPVSLVGLSTAAFPIIYLKSNLSYSSDSPPILYDWQVDLNSIPNTPTLDLPISTSSNLPLIITFKTTATDIDEDYLRYKIVICKDPAMTVSCQTFDQTISQLGWSGQDAETGTAYLNGTQATYTLQAELDSITTYYWKTQAIDPGGSDHWSPTQTDPYSFITSTVPEVPTLDSPLNTHNNIIFAPTLLTTGTDADNDYLRYKIELCENSAMTSSCQTFDQTVSQTGWSGQDAETGTAYVSGTQASYTLQSNLVRNTTYYWRSYAIDPGGSDSWSNTQSAPYSFTTLSTPFPANTCFIRESTDDSQLVVVWTDDAFNEDFYEVQRSIDGGAWTVLQTGIAANTTSLLDNTVSSGHTYQYRIAPYFIGPYYSQWCTVSTLTLELGLFNFEGIRAEGLRFD